MILNNEHLTQRMDLAVQNQEIARIKNAPVGEVLFSCATSANADLIDTLLHKAKVRYTVRVADYTARYVKEA